MIMLPRSRRILIVDDNPALAAVLKYNLEQSGFEATVCRNGLDAWNILNNSTNEFEMMITGHQLPKITGLELCEMIRWEHLRPELVIFLVTEKSLELDVLTVQKHLGIEKVVSRPFSPIELIAEVEQTFEDTQATNSNPTSAGIH